MMWPWTGDVGTPSGAARVGWSEYAEDLAFREALYSGSMRDALPHLRKWINARYEAKEQRAGILQGYGWSPLTRLVVDTLATAYLAPPRRTWRYADSMEPVADGSPEAAACADWASASPLDDLGRRYEAQSILLCAAWLWVQWDPYTARPRYSVVSPARVQAMPHPSWPTDVQRCYWVRVQRHAQVATAGSSYSLPARLWDLYQRQPDGMVAHSVVDDAGRPAQIESRDYLGKVRVETPAYPLLRDYPLIWLADGEADCLWPEGNHDLIEEPVSYGVGVAETRMAMRYTAFPQLVIEGARQHELDNITVGPGVSLSIQEGQAKYLEPGGSMRDADALRQEHVGRWLRSRHLPPDMWLGDGRVESGVALYMQRLPLLEQRKMRLPRFEAYEAELWRTTTLVRAAHVGMGDYAPEWSGSPRVEPADMMGITMVATFPGAEPVLSPSEAYALRRMRWEDGIESPAQMLADERGIGVEEARSIIAANKRDSAPVAPTEAPNPNIQALLAGVSG